MRIDHPKNRKFVVCRSEDGSVLHRVSVGPDQSMATGQPVVEQTESEIDHLKHLSPFADKLPPLPTEGEEVRAGEVYAHEGGAVMARKDHPRDSRRPDHAPDLFITPDSDGVDWVPSEPVGSGTVRRYDGSTYRSKKEQVTENEPPVEPELWGSLVNVNSASSEELQTLSGVGASLAQKIIDDRPFEAVEDLTRVSGISEGMVSDWGDGVTV